MCISLHASEVSMELTPQFIRENYYRAVEFRYPLFIPSFVSIPVPTWRKYGEKLSRLVEKHRLLFPWFNREFFDVQKLPRKPSVFKDEWGCVWRFPIDGLQGIVVKHPIDEWEKLKSFKAPDPDLGLPREGEPPISWDEVESFIRSVKDVGGLAVGFMPHGFLFLRLTYLRGYLNFLKDLVLKPPQLEVLIDMVVEYNVAVVKRLTRLGVDVISFGDDLGAQTGLPFSPLAFRRHLLPGYRRIFAEARRKGAKVRLHSDGYIMDIASDLIAAGVDVLNLQDRVHGLEMLSKLKGRVAIEVDIDRQKLLPFGSPKSIEEHIRSVVFTLGSRRGGLLLSAEVLHDVPFNNIEALFDALERFSTAHRSI